MFKLNKADHQFLESARGQYPEEAKWYAILTHWGRERKVRDQLLKDFSTAGLQEILLPEAIGIDPQASNPETPELLFGGHVFLRSALNDEVYGRVCNYKEVFRILGRAYRIPTVIPDQEIELFKQALTLFPRPTFATAVILGDNVKVMDGIMEGLQGKAVQISAKYVKIETRFSFLNQGNCIVVSVPRHQVILASETSQDSINNHRAVAQL